MVSQKSCSGIPDLVREPNRHGQYIYVYVYMICASGPPQAASAAGSWAGPGPGQDRLGLKCSLALGGTRVVGGGRDNFMCLNHNFSLVTAKGMLNAFVHTNFSIRAFWPRWDKTNIL